MDLLGDENDLTARKRQEFEDLQNEIAGRETGRRSRFLPNGPGSDEARRKRREDRAFRARLAALLSDPVYRAKYEFAMTTLSDAESAVDAALMQTDHALLEANSHLHDVQDIAARLPDGSRVYKDAVGNVRKEDGSLVDPVLVDTIIWSGNEPRFEDYQAAVDRIEALEQSKRDVEGYQNEVLGPARDRLTDEENPPSLDDLDDITKDMQTLMPDIVRDHMPQTRQAAPEVQSSNIGLPKLGG